MNTEEYKAPELMISEKTLEKIAKLQEKDLIKQEKARIKAEQDLIKQEKARIKTEEAAQKARIKAEQNAEKAKEAAAKLAEYNKKVSLAAEYNMTTNAKGVIENTIENYVNIIEKLCNDKDNIIRTNEFNHRKMIGDKYFADTDRSKLFAMINGMFTEMTNEKFFDHAVNVVADKNKYNPVENYLDNLVWDGKKRMEKCIINWLKVADNELNREMTKIWFLGAVKRIKEPGCQFDNMIIIQGGQGCGKTSFCRKLAKNTWYSDNINISDKSYINEINEKWIVILDELKTFGKKENAEIKNFITRTDETARLAYARNAETYKRHCVFIGSTNEATFLKDFSGGLERRYFVMKSDGNAKDGININNNLMEEEIDQIWAEAVYMYNQDKNIKLYLSPELSEELFHVQKEFKTCEDDNNLETLLDVLDREYILNDKGEFNDINDFDNQINGCFINKIGKKQKIVKLPIAYLTVIYKKYGIKQMRNEYIKAGSNNCWEKKNAQYNKKVCKCLVRCECGETNIENNDTMENLFS